MKIGELLQEETTYEIGKTINTELRELAHQLDLTWGEMPGFVKAGAWYGGRLTPKGGRTAEAKREMTLPFDRRVKGFFKQLTRYLQQKQGEGCSVDVAVNTTKNGKVSPLNADQIQSMFDNVSIREIRAGQGSVEVADVRWYISFSQQQSMHSQFIRLDGRVWGHSFVSLYYDVAFTVGAQLKDVKKKLVAIDKNAKVSSYFVADLLPIWAEHGGKLPKANTPQKALTLEEYIKVAKNPRLTPQPGDYRQDQSGTINIKGGVMAAGTVKLPADEVIAVINKHWSAL